MKLTQQDIGMNNAAELSALGIEAIRSGDLAFDLSEVRSCDSSAVAVLLSWQREAQTSGRALQLIGVPSCLMSLARVYGVEPLLTANQTGAG